MTTEEFLPSVFSKSEKAEIFVSFLINDLIFKRWLWVYVKYTWRCGQSFRLFKVN